MGSLSGLSKEGFLPSVSRRIFLKASAALAAAGGALVTLASPKRLFAQVPQGAQVPAFDDETFYWASDSFNCAGMNCLHKIYVKNGRITRVATDDTGDADDAYGCPQVRNCVRGKSTKFRVYDPYRVKYPLERTGPRGSGEYRRVSWDYATQKVATELRRIGKQYGPHSVLINAMTAGMSMGVNGFKGTLGMIGVVPALAGPVVMPLNDTSMGGVITDWLGVEMGTTGQGLTDFRQVAEHSNMVILVGCNQTTNTYLCNTPYRLAKMRERLRERGVKVYGIDPRFNYAFSYLVDEWIPINPQSDAALFAAMMNAQMQENLINWDYIKRFTNGWDQYQAYLLGKTDSDDPKVRRWADGIAKTPEWAERITGIPATKIHQLAIEYASKQPAALMMSLGPNRGAIGHSYYWAGITMAIATGNVGKLGNWAGIAGSLPSMSLLNTLKSAAGMTGLAAGMMTPSMAGFVGAAPGLLIRIVPAVFLGEMLLNPEKPLPFGEKAPIIRASVSVGNPVNTWPGSGKITKGLCQPRIEFSCAIDYAMTATAKISDIVLPAATSVELEDFQSLLASGSPGVAYHAGLVKPAWESKPDAEIWGLVAQKGGVGTAWQGNPSTSSVVKIAVAMERLVNPKLPSVEEMRKNPEKAVQKDHYEPLPTLTSPYTAQINHGVPFGTPSGKFEVYSETLERLHSAPSARDMWWLPNDYPGMRDMMKRIPPIPAWVDHWEGPLDPKQATYPLQTCAPASIRRSHSAWSNNVLLDDVWGPDVVWIHPEDATARGVKNGDIVQVFNDRGTVQVRAWVTNRVKKGVMALENGRWPSFAKPGGEGVDLTGGQSTLTRDCEFLGTMMPHALQFLANIVTHTGLVDVRKVADAPAFQGDPANPLNDGGVWSPTYPFAIDGVSQTPDSTLTNPESGVFVDGITWNQEKAEGKTADKNVQAYISQGQQSTKTRK